MLLGTVTSSPPPAAAARQPISGETTSVLLPTAAGSESVIGPARPELRDGDPRPSTDQAGRMSPGVSTDWAVLRRSPSFALDRRLFEQPLAGETASVRLPTVARSEPVIGPTDPGLGEVDPRPLTAAGPPTDQSGRKSPGESTGSPDWAALRQSPGFALDQRLLGRIRRFLPTGVPPVTIKAGAAADRIARRYRADALAAGPLVLFRSGRWQPTAERGQALLGHELVHAAQAGTNGSRTGQVDARADEQAARRVESRILGYWRYAGADGSATAETPTTPAAAASASPSMPMSPTPEPGQPGSAAATLGVTVLPSLPAAPPPSPGADAGPALATASEGRTVEPQMPRRQAEATLTSQQLRSLKDEIYEDLRRRIRVDFERGA